MKVKPSVKPICDKCKVIRRHGVCHGESAKTRATNSARAKPTVAAVTPPAGGIVIGTAPHCLSSDKGCGYLRTQRPGTGQIPGQ